MRNQRAKQKIFGLSIGVAPRRGMHPMPVWVKTLSDGIIHFTLDVHTDGQPCGLHWQVPSQSLQKSFDSNHKVVAMGEAAAPLWCFREQSLPRRNRCGGCFLIFIPIGRLHSDASQSLCALGRGIDAEGMRMPTTIQRSFEVSNGVASL